MSEAGGRLKKMLICQSLAILVIFYATQAISQDTLYPDYYTKGKPSIMRGYGATSCGTFIKDPSASKESLQWILGYLNGMDSFNPYTTKPYDYNGLNLWLEEYCKKHPLEIMANAGLAFYKEIGGRAPMTPDVTIWQHFPPTAQ